MLANRVLLQRAIAREAGVARLDDARFSRRICAARRVNTRRQGRIVVQDAGLFETIMFSGNTGIESTASAFEFGAKQIDQPLLTS
jgi:hypothetical protein